MRTLIVLLLLAAIGAAEAAPAPLPRPARRPAPASLAGAWLLHWHGRDWDVFLWPDGTYAASAPGEDWHGTWASDGPTLSVRETDGSTRLEWSLDLTPGRGGDDAPAVWVERR